MDKALGELFGSGNKVESAYSPRSTEVAPPSPSRRSDPDENKSSSSSTAAGLFNAIVHAVTPAAAPDYTTVDLTKGSVQLDVFSHESLTTRYVHAIRVIFDHGDDDENKKTTTTTSSSSSAIIKKRQRQEPVMIGSPKTFSRHEDKDGNKSISYNDMSANNNALSAGPDEGRFVTAITGRTSQRFGHDTLERLRFETIDDYDGSARLHKRCGGRGGEKFQIVAPDGQYVASFRVSAYQAENTECKYIGGIHDVVFADLPKEVAALQLEKHEAASARIMRKINKAVPGAMDYLGMGEHELASVRRFVRGDTSTEETEDFYVVMLGVVLMGFAFAAINVNERRAVKQDMLNEWVEDRMVSPHQEAEDAKDAGVTASLLKDLTLEDLVDEPLHAHGELVPKSSDSIRAWPTDSGLKVQAVNTLRLHRTVELFQWIETRHEDVKRNKEGKVTSRRVYYTYHKAWSSHHQTVSHDASKINPPFPSIPGPAAIEPHKIDMEVHDHPELNLRISDNFISRFLRDFRDCNTLEVVDGGDAAKQEKLEMKGSSKLYSIGGSESSPKIGDVRVTYTAVKDGPFTGVGKYTETGYFAAFTAKLHDALAAEAPLAMPWARAGEIPDEGSTLARKILARKKFVNTRAIERAADVTAVHAESWVMAMAPLEYARMWRGIKTKKEAHAQFQTECDARTFRIFCGCTALAATGLVLLDPSTCLESIAFAMSPATLVGSMPLAYAGRWRAQKLALGLKHKGLRRGGGGDVSFSGDAGAAADRSFAKRVEMPGADLKQEARKRVGEVAKQGVIGAIRNMFRK